MRFLLIFLLCLSNLSCWTIKAQYTGTGSVTQGLGTVTTANLLPNCTSNHVTPIGTIKSTDGIEWIVPAENNFATGAKLSDLYNTCNRVTPTTLAAADLTNVPVKVIDAEGDIITGYIFADNYFELYINGVLVGIDPIPFTPFNSCVVKFKVSKPYTIAVKLIDWEENVGLGSEIRSATELYHPGDGGFIAQFSDGTVTDATWKAQTFYIAPIQTLNTVVEQANGTRSTANATTTPTCNATCYGIHYPIPTNWADRSFNDTGWPSATLYTAAQVTNDVSYTNFATTAWGNAKFIWSSNLILDNLVLVRKTVGATSAIKNIKGNSGFKITNPFSNQLWVSSETSLKNATIILTDIMGKTVQTWASVNTVSQEKWTLNIPPSVLEGFYVLSIQDEQRHFTTQLLHLNKY